MVKIKLVLLILFISLFISGCVDETGNGTPASTPDVTETETPVITAAPTPEPTPVREPVSFKSEVDNYYGFIKVTKIGTAERELYDYKNRTLTIYAGDKVIWFNYAEDPEEKLTLVSEEGLWGKDNISAIMTARYKEFSYTFTKPGVYGVYIKEYPHPRIQRQKIIVNP